VPVVARVTGVHDLDNASGRHLLGGVLLKCGVCGGPISVSGQRVKNGVRYATFGCTAHQSRGASICSNGSTISEKRINARSSARCATCSRATP